MAVIPTVLPTAGTTPAAVAASQLKVDERSKIVQDMGESWPMIEALIGGTEAMRKNPGFLPQEDRESPREWAYRLRTATLYPAFNRTVGVMSGKPFAKQLTPDDDVPELLKEYADNIDNQGRNAHAFFYDQFEEALNFGICGVLVDEPKTIVADPAAQPTLADRQAQKIRPYFTFVKHTDVLGWKTHVVEGVLKLSQLRLREEIEVDDGEYGTAMMPAVRVLTPGAWQLYKKTGDGYTLTPEDQGTTNLKDIPYVPFYGRRKGFMIGQSPLIDLAYLNVKHYQIQSDQDDSARFARKRLLVFSGVDSKNLTDIEASSNSAIALGAEGKVEVVQGSAESVTVGRNELTDLEEQMVRTGAELLVMKPGGQRTATQDNNEAEGNKSELQRIVETFEDAIDQCFQFAAEFMGEENGGHWSMFKDFGASNLTDASADLVLKMQTAGLITKKTAIIEQQRRGNLSADIDPDDELEAVDEEGPPPGMLGLDEDGNPLPMGPNAPPQEIDPLTGKPKPAKGITPPQLRAPAARMKAIAS